MGHTLLLSGVGLDVDNVSDLVGSQVGGHGDHTLVCKPSTHGKSKIPRETQRFVRVGVSITDYSHRIQLNRGGGD